MSMKQCQRHHDQASKKRRALTSQLKAEKKTKRLAQYGKPKAMPKVAKPSKKSKAAESETADA